MKLVKSSLVNFCYISGSTIMARFYLVKHGEKINIDKPIITDCDIEKLTKLNKPWKVEEKMITKETGRFTTSDLYNEIKFL